MNYLKIEYEGTECSFKCPDNWSEVPYHKFVTFQKGGLTPTQVYELFTGVSSEIWELPHDPQLYTNIDGQLAFLSTEPKIELPTHLERKGVFYKIKKNLLNVPLGKYRDIIEITKEVAEDSDNTLGVFPKMVGVFACDSYDDEEELNEIAKEVNLMPSDLVYSLGCFFLQKLSELNPGTPKKWHEQAKIKMLNILKQVLTKLLVSLAICIAFILLPKTMFVGTMQYFRRMWVKYIVLNNLRVVSINQKHNTID